MYGITLLIVNNQPFRNMPYQSLTKQNLFYIDVEVKFEIIEQLFYS